MLTPLLQGASIIEAIGLYLFVTVVKTLGEDIENDLGIRQVIVASGFHKIEPKQ